MRKLRDSKQKTTTCCTATNQAETRPMLPDWVYTIPPVFSCRWPGSGQELVHSRSKRIATKWGAYQDLLLPPPPPPHGEGPSLERRKKLRAGEKLLADLIDPFAHPLTKRGGVEAEEGTACWPLAKSGRGPPPCVVCWGPLKIPDFWSLAYKHKLCTSDGEWRRGTKYIQTEILEKRVRVHGGSGRAWSTWHRGVQGRDAAFVGETWTGNSTSGHKSVT